MYLSSLVLCFDSEYAVNRPAMSTFLSATIDIATCIQALLAPWLRFYIPDKSPYDVTSVQKRHYYKRLFSHFLHLYHYLKGTVNFHIIV